MKHTAYIYTELKEITPFLAELEKNNVFSVPENYFSSLDAAILNSVIPRRFDALPAVEIPFTVPAEYFENLTGNILKKIKSLEAEDASEELIQVSPTLYQLRNANLFSIPAGYFETLPTALLHIVSPRAKVVTMKKRSMVWNCAAAAMITGVMAISAVWTGNTSLPQDNVTADNKTNALNSDALQYKNAAQIKEGIADLSNADIIKYLETSGSNAEDDALASSVSDNELPDEQDYLTDENTLQNFLGKTNSKNNQN